MAAISYTSSLSEITKSTIIVVLIRGIIHPQFQNCICAVQYIFNAHLVTIYMLMIFVLIPMLGRRLTRRKCSFIEGKPWSFKPHVILQVLKSIDLDETVSSVLKIIVFWWNCAIAINGTRFMLRFPRPVNTDTENLLCRRLWAKNPGVNTTNSPSSISMA